MGFARSFLASWLLLAHQCTHACRDELSVVVVGRNSSYPEWPVGWFKTMMGRSFPSGTVRDPFSKWPSGEVAQEWPSSDRNVAQWPSTTGSAWLSLVAQ